VQKMNGHLMSRFLLDTYSLKGIRLGLRLGL
jgi:hypothetical protein